jgi:DNA-binding LytR/AlgR family response regulator
MIVVLFPCFLSLSFASFLCFSFFYFPISMSLLLTCLIVHRLPPIARSLARDLQKIDPTLTHIHKATIMAEAATALANLKPNVVFLDLEIPNEGAFALLQQHPPSECGYALILLDQESLGPAERQRHVQLVTQHQAAGYLMPGVFGNGTLSTALEQAEHRLQGRLLAERQREVIELLIEMLLAKKTKEHTKRVHDAATSNGKSQTAIEHISDGIVIPEQNTRAAKNKRLVQWSNVIRLVAKGNYYEVWHIDAEEKVATVLVRKECVAKTVLPPHFLQTHRSHIVNTKKIINVRTKDLLMMCGNHIPLSRRQQEQVQEMLGKISVQSTVVDRLSLLN